jgi:hypothetical protein
MNDSTTWGSRIQVRYAKHSYSREQGNPSSILSMTLRQAIRFWDSTALVEGTGHRALCGVWRRQFQPVLLSLTAG